MVSVADSPTKYDDIPQSLRSEGAARIIVPFRALVQQYRDDLVRQVLPILRTGEGLTHIQEQLDDGLLGADALSLSEWYDQAEIPVPKLVKTLKDLRKLAAIAEELAEDGGAWRSTADGDLKERQEQALADLCERGRKLLVVLKHRHGNRASRQCWKAATRTLQHQQAILNESTPHWSAEQSAELRRVAEQIRRLTRPSGLIARIWQRCLGDVPLKRYLDRMDLHKLSRQHKAVESAARQRMEQRRWQSQRILLELLLGTPDRPGCWMQLADQVEAEDTLFTSLDLQLQHKSRTPGLSNSGDTLTLVESLDDRLDGTQTVRDLFNDLAARGGCTAARIAETVRSDGLIIDGRPVSREMLSSEDPSRVIDSLRAIASQFLDSVDGLADLDQPRLAIDHLAGFTLTSFDLRSRLLAVTNTWIDRSQPRATFGGLSDCDVHQSCYLLCHSQDRPLLEELLLGEPLAPNYGGKYDTRNPFEAQLIQVRLAAPVGASREYWKCRAAANLQLKAGVVKERYPLRQFPELRLLASRIRDRGDCARILAANRRHGDVYEVGDGAGRLALSQHDPRLHHLFAPTTFTARWQAPRTFAEALRGGGPFWDFLQAGHPRIPNFRGELAQLALNSTDEQIAEELSALGVVEGRGGLYRLVRPMSTPQPGAPAHLYDRTYGDITGLSEEDFIGELVKNDLLYTILFCTALDRLQLGMLTERDLPDSVVAMARRLRL